MNKIELKLGDSLEIKYTIIFQNTKHKKVSIDLDKLKDSLFKYTQKYKKLYTWVK